jgi:hypothetical protein
LGFSKKTESGFFSRTTIRKDGKSHTETIKFKPNQKKVILGFLGELEVYVYPFDFPDKVFLGKFPLNTEFDSTNVQTLLGAYNKVKWFLAGQWQKKPKTTIRTQMRRQRISTAYNLGLSDKLTTNSASSYGNSNLGDRPELVYKCPFCLAEIWFNTIQELRHHIDNEIINRDRTHQKLTPKQELETKKWAIKKNGKWKILE